MNAGPATRTPLRPARPHRTASTRRAHSPYADDAKAWTAWCAAAGARLDATQRAADAVAWCAAGRARAFALPSKLRSLDGDALDQLHARIADGDTHPRLRVHVVHVGEGQGRPLALAVLDVIGRAPLVVGQLGDHHTRWIAALPPNARDALSLVVLRCTGGDFGRRSRGVNVAITGIGPAVRLAATLPAPALPTAIAAEPGAGYHARRIPLGRVVATPGALDTFDPVALSLALSRHQRGDWGDVDADDRQSNERALRTGERLLSAYDVAGGRLWIITEADRSATTLLRPDEY